MYDRLLGIGMLRGRGHYRVLIKRGHPETKTAPCLRLRASGSFRKATVLGLWRSRESSDVVFLFFVGIILRSRLLVDDKRGQEAHVDVLICCSCWHLVFKGAASASAQV